MTKSALNDEIKEIGSHLENMEKQRKTKNRKAEGKADTPDEAAQPEDDGSISDEDLAALKAMLADFDAQDVIDSVSTHAKAWMSTLNEDLKNTKPSTLLTVFGLGVIVGRLTK